MGNLPLTMSLVVLGWFNDPINTGIASDRVDMMEVNHFYDEKGKLVFNQIIFFDWSAPDSRYMVRDWKLVKSKSQMPVKDTRTGDYVIVWYDGDLLRVVRCPLIRETWTQHDPELIEREYLPKERRAMLSTPGTARTVLR